MINHCHAYAVATNAAWKGPGSNQLQHMKPHREAPNTKTDNMSALLRPEVSSMTIYLAAFVKTAQTKSCPGGLNASC